MTVWCEDHKQYDCSHELTKLVDELAADNERLQAELTATQAVLNAAMAGRRWQIDRALKTEAENARLTVQLRIAENALEAIRGIRGIWPTAKANEIAREALSRVSVVE